MKQLLQYLRTGEAIIADVPVPTPQPGEVLVRNAASLVSAGTERMVVSFAEKSLLGKVRSRPDLARQVIDKARREGALSTLEATFNRLDQPMALGYSSAGTVIGLGEGVSGLSIGQRVACAGGGYAVHAEFVAVPKILVTAIPDSVDFESAAFATLGAIALHGFRLSHVQLGEVVAVIGLGLLGLLSLAIAQAAGCQVIGVDLDPERVALAQAIGAHAVLRKDAEEAAASISRGRGCDAVLICADSSTSDPVELAGAIARDRARVVAVGAVGLNLPRKVYYEKELTFLNSRSYGPGRYDPGYEEGGQDYPLGYVRWTEGRNLEAFVDLLAAGKVPIQKLITHRFEIDQASQAYALITGKQSEPFLGVILRYPEAATTREQTSVVGALDDASSIPEEPARGERAGSPIQLGVLGAGNFATAVLLPAIKKIPAIQRVSIASASGASAQNAAQRFGFQNAVSDEQDVLENSQINTIAILTRHHLHARQVQAALNAGKNVFCEKPLALTETELKEIAQALDQNQGRVLLMVGFNRRFAPLAVRLKEFLAGRSEPLIAQYRVNAGYIPPNHWTHDPQQGGGRIIGEGCHFIDLITFLVGQSPVMVSAIGLPDGGRYREDNLVISLTYPDGSQGTVTYLANGDKTFPKERLEVFCGGRVAVLDDYRSLELVHAGRKQTQVSRLRQDKGHHAEWIAFEAAVRTGGPPPIPYAQLFGVSRASMAAQQALRGGQTIRLTG